MVKEYPLHLMVGIILGNSRKVNGMVKEYSLGLMEISMLENERMGNLGTS